MENCSTCQHWKRDGIDGICFGGTPQPIIVPKGKPYVTMWPRTNPGDGPCGSHKTREDKAQN